MATPTDEAPKDGGDSQPLDRKAAFSNLKTQFEAEEKGETPAPKPADDDDDTPAGDAEADNDAPQDNPDDDGGNGDDDDSPAGDDDQGKPADDDQGSDFKPRLSQFKGDGTEADYRKNLENGYIESSNEGIKQRERADGLERQVEAIKAAAAKDPELGEKLLKHLNDGNAKGTPNGKAQEFSDQATQDSSNPFLVHAETEWNAKNEKSVQEFVDANPEVLTDPKVKADVIRWSQVFTKNIYETEKRLITTGEAMDMAYKHLGLDNKKQSQESLVNGMKKNAAPTRPQAAKKNAGSGSKKTEQFSDLTLRFAQNMGISKDRLVKGTKR